MIPALRKKYNAAFTEEKYQDFLKEMNSIHEEITFRLSETPIFVPQSFLQQMLDACESIVDIIKRPDFKTLTANAVPKNLIIPGENDFPHCIAFDFGICINEDGELEPQMIEMQGFPSLFAYEIMLEDIFRKHFEVPENFTGYIAPFNEESYLKLLKEVIIKDHDPQNVVLLELFPEQQKTRIDFHCTKGYLGVKPVCITKVIKRGKQLFYNNDGVETQIKRVYNRLIFDELMQQAPEVQEKAKILFEELEVEWVPHPHWFYRISKYTLPFIAHPNIPRTYFVNELKDIPEDLENYVLKPLFSFAGQGVIIDVAPEDIQKLKDPENWILQKKVNYAPVIETMDEPAKAEIRIFYFWQEGADRPLPANNLSRMSKGKMIGVRYNKDKTWTGGSFCLFERK